jgi:predicted AlkP superfamily pyrophosphatase or phosphodiesterase
MTPASRPVTKGVLRGHFGILAFWVAPYRKLAEMRNPQRRLCSLLLLCLAATATFASAYDARPKLLVIVVIDQFRGDLLPRYAGEFGESGFRLFLEKGAYFTDCNYNYANTRTAPGHATLATGAYTDGHGIMANEWWDPAKKRRVTSVEDESVRLLGGSGTGSSPHNLLADSLGDELKVATGGKARVFGIALKDRAAILSTGFAADYAFWIDHANGHWITSSYYATDLPGWVKDFNSAGRAEKYWNLQWKDAGGRVLRSTTRDPQKPDDFYEVVGATPFANDYELEFARELLLQEKLGTGTATDLLVISLSANDILGHKVGPDSNESHAMVLALDHQLSDFFGFLGRQLGLANVWIGLSADHGVAPMPAYAAGLRLPAKRVDVGALRKQINAELSSRWGNNEYVRLIEWPVAYLNEDAFAAAKITEADAERAVGDALKPAGMRSYFTRSQLAGAQVPADELGRRYLHSYSPYGGWYVLGYPAPFVIGQRSDTDHATVFTYDTHVPLGFFGLGFQPGIYHTHCEPVDLAATLASLLGINAPTSVVGRVLTEAVAPIPPSRTTATQSQRPTRTPASTPPQEQPK